MSYVTSLFHIVFSTKKRVPALTPQYQNDLYAVIGAILNKYKCKPLIINGIEDHVHMLIGLHPQVCLSDIVRDVKSQSSVWAKNSGHFPMFDGWESEYGAFSLSDSHKDAVYKYISGQKDHHKDNGVHDEYERLVMKNGLVYYRPPEDK